jgi:hypothetical protein
MELVIESVWYVGLLFEPGHFTVLLSVEKKDERLHHRVLM